MSGFAARVNLTCHVSGTSELIFEQMIFCCVLALDNSEKRYPTNSINVAF